MTKRKLSNVDLISINCVDPYQSATAINYCQKFFEFGKSILVTHQDVDVYDIVLEHLIENGYAESYEAAEKIMVNMSEEWRDEILDEANKAEREIGLSSMAREQARNLNRNADKPIFYKNTLMGKSSDSNLNRAHKQMTAKRQASHKAGRHLRGDAGEKGNVVKSRYQANKDHTDGYPSITKRGQGPT